MTSTIDSFPKSNLLRNAGISWVEADRAQDVEMALLVDEGDGARCCFLDVLHSVLIKRRSSIDDARAPNVVCADLAKWYHNVPNEEPLVWWLKMAIERYPMRLFVACDWQCETGFHPAEDQFWFALESDEKGCIVEDKNRGLEGEWCTPDPRPWRSAPWRRFLGKRICWLKLNDISANTEMLKRNSSTLIRRSFPGFFVEDGGGSKLLELLPLWLRLRWVEHLACRVRGLDWSYNSQSLEVFPRYGALRLLLDLKTSDSSRTHRPATLPPLEIPKVQEAGACRVTLPKPEIIQSPSLMCLSTGQPLKGIPFAELCWDQANNAKAYCVMQMHKEVFSPAKKGKWQAPPLRDIQLAIHGSYSGAALSVVFGGALSGGLLSHNALSDLVRDSRSQRAALRFLEIAEHALLRVAVCDERLQSWWDRDERIATNAIQRRVFSLFWDKPGACKQAKRPMHGYYGVLHKSDIKWELKLFEKRKGGGLRFIFASDPWPAAAEVLVVHQGILDKCKESSRTAIELAELKNDIPWVVVTSGRGKPDRIPSGVRFLAFSGLQASLVGDRCDKFLLVRQLEACGGEV